ncbi:immunity protein 49 of polymorphic toxin system [Volucribacter psittacicida]|uniref:Immunity protein 49 of polymorphic toxin system n=1 Tax=Volucribacter psittacicida TaxID=203482 RepID=A0A4R1G5V8_9PAST|nr:immunity 49 family protein [Volucribacter psittacicida]TCK01875.1 immunity protein 49 of polymorphic toxin system [Volucribacter psittacicida]
MSNNYKIFLGSVTEQNYEECIQKCQSEADYLYKKGHFDLYEVDLFKGTRTLRNKPFSMLEEELKCIKEKKEHPLYSMRWISNYYAAQASLDLLLNADVKAFKKHAYIAGKLLMLSQYDYQWAYNDVNIRYFFTSIMSDSPDLINFLIKHRDEIVSVEAPYKRYDARPFFNANTLLALSGEWELLKNRSQIFLNDERKARNYLKRIPDHEFYVALCDKDIEGMKTALNKLLDLKKAKRAVYDTNVWFDFYLQLQVLLYAKIAAIHGFDLGIDSPIAPKELIEYKPLKPREYEDPYDFMKEFDYNQPIMNWINYWNAIIEENQREAKKNRKKPSWFQELISIIKIFIK